MADSLETWCKKELSERFSMDLGPEGLREILSIINDDELQRNLMDKLRGDNRKKRRFIEQLLQRRHSECHLQLPDDVQVYRKKEEQDKFQKPEKGKKKGKNKAETKGSNLNSDPQTSSERDSALQDKVATDGGPKKTKFVSLYSKEGEHRLTVLLPGRHSCDCLAQKHALINNCMECGRIVCRQEGSGPCLFCGNLVCTQEEMEVLSHNSNKSEKLRRKLLGNDEDRIGQGLDKAIQHRDKLLDYDKNCIKRTQVIDDESDYFASDSNLWISMTEREALKKREEERHALRHASRLSRGVKLDLAGRRVLLDDEPLMPDVSANHMESTPALIPCQNAQESHLQQSSRRELVNPRVQGEAPQWVEVKDSRNLCNSSSIGGNPWPEDQELDCMHPRVQDRGFLEISDAGLCLSLHQPWASLLIRGIKTTEGRSWYTAHRGRLWIAAAAARPSPEEVVNLEEMYRHLNPDKELPFPKDYPTSCLLGCVLLTDCLTQEQYRAQFPDGESDSPFLFICENPQELRLKFPIKGQHKIWKLDSNMHQGARRGLMQQLQREM
uniref:ASCH domain-containing protein n=1 Tax=Eptatretus burgeri TaxID=7764 RepID=A0A8C4QG95_EPTBU